MVKFFIGNIFISKIFLLISMGDGEGIFFIGINFNKENFLLFKFYKGKFF